MNIEHTLYVRTIVPLNVCYIVPEQQFRELDRIQAVKLNPRAAEMLPISVVCLPMLTR